MKQYLKPKICLQSDEKVFDFQRAASQGDRVSEDSVFPDSKVWFFGRNPGWKGIIATLALSLSAATGWGQTYFNMSLGNYSESFTGWTNHAANWNGLATNSTGSIPSATRVTTASTSIIGVGSSTGVQSATNSTNIQLLSAGPTDNTTSTGLDLNLNFSGRNAGNFSFDAAQVANSTGNRGGTLRVYYSTDGSTWTELTATNLPFVATNNVAKSASISVTLPSALNNQSTVKLRFYSHNGPAGGASPTGSRPKISIDNVSVISTAAAGLTPPTLTAAINATVDAAFEVTFVDDSAWRAAITSITVGGTTLATGAYSVTSGKITFTPSASALLQSSGSKSIAVIATGYSNAAVTQSIGVGAASKLAVTTQPAAPASNGAALATQPAVTVQDQYGNTVTGSSASITAAKGDAGTWTLGGTTSVNASSGVATFSGLTATSATAVSGATITFSSAGLTGATSSTFNIPVPAPVNDLSSNSTSITVNGAASSGTTLGATRSSPWTSGGSDVWYQFTAPATGTVSVTTTTTSSSRQDLDLSAWSNSAPAATSGSIMSGGSSSSDTTTESGTISATNGIVYFIRVLRFNDGGTAGAFTITATMPVAPSTQATSFTSSSITSSSATVGWARGNGTGGVLVVARAGGAVTTDPTDGTNYTANATFGSGTQIGTGNYVVYKGTGTSVNVTGLSAGTTYHFEVYEYNTDGLMHNMAGLIGNLTTSAGVPTVTSSAATSVGSTAATLNGNPTAEGGDAITGRGFVYSTTDTTPTIGETGVTQVSLSGTTGAMSTALSSLGANTTYHFNAYAINSFGTSYGTVQSFTTSQLSAPTTLAASATTSTGFTANWNAVDGATGYQLDVYTGSSSTTTLYSANFNTFTGSGFTFAPAAGQLDSDDWKVTGMTDAASPVFGGNYTTADFAGGASTGGVTTGGIYAFTVGAGNVALGVQPTGSDWVPGTIVLRIQNTTGLTLTSLDVSYKIWVLNDQGRSSSFNFSHSANDSTYTSVSALDYASTATADVTPAWVSVNRSTTITGLSIPNNAYYYLRWSGADVSGSGSRDEFALDDVQVSSTTSNIVYLSGFQNLSVGNVSAYAVTGAATATGYSYVVRATSANSTSANSDVRAVTTKGITLISVNSGTTSLTYSGLAQGPSFTVTGSAGALTYSYAGTGGTTYGPSTTAPTNVGTYTVTATVAADANFDGATSSATAFSIQAATLGSGDITLTPVVDGSYTASAAGVSGFTLSYAGRSANGVTTSYASSASAPTLPGFYTVTATSSDANYSGSKSENYFIAGLVAGNDSVTKPTDNSRIKIPVATLLANDGRILGNGTVQTATISITGVTQGTGTAASISGAFVLFTPANGNSGDSFTYTLTDSSDNLTATGTVTVSPETAPPSFDLQIVGQGTASYNGTQTSITMDFIGVPNQNYTVEYKGELADAAWTSAGAQSTGSTGSFSVTFTKAGNHTADWNGSMFFRASVAP